MSSVSADEQPSLLTPVGEFFPVTFYFAPACSVLELVLSRMGMGGQGDFPRALMFGQQTLVLISITKRTYLEHTTYAVACGLERLTSEYPHMKIDRISLPRHLPGNGLDSPNPVILCSSLMANTDHEI